MTDYVYHHSIWLALVSAVFVGLLGLYSWRRRDVPGARPLAISCLFIGLWLLGIAGEAAAHDLTAKITWRTFQGLVQLPAVTADTCFVLAYAYPGRWLTRRNVSLLFLPSLLAALLILTNDSHHLIWQSFNLDVTLQTVRGSANWLLTGYAFSLILISTLILVQLFIRSPLHRWPVALMLLGQVGAVAIYLLEIVFRDRQHPGRLRRRSRCCFVACCMDLRCSASAYLTRWSSPANWSSSRCRKVWRFLTRTDGSPI